VTVAAVGKGTVVLKGWYGNKVEFYSLTDCLHIPNSRVNLISQFCLDKHGIEAYFGSGKITLVRNGTKIIGGGLEDDMYRLYMEPLTHTIPDNPLVLMATNSGELPGFYTA
jgi:hypothetical protein